MLNDGTGKPIRAWDSRGFTRRTTYDGLRRPTEFFVTENGAERLAEHTVYGESKPNPETENLRGKVFQVFDGAGVVTSKPYDFKGNLLSGKRQLAELVQGTPAYKTTMNWSAAVQLETDTYTSFTTYDALNRPLTVTKPDSSIYSPTFNEANLLDKVDVNLRGAKDVNGKVVWTPFVTNINYNAKGQRELIAYGNSAKTTYDYDPLIFRLTKLTTTRPPNPDIIASQLFKSAALVQDLRYTYDPVGNITRIEDAALKTIFHNGERVEPVSDYTYDAIYRLIEAHGREHIGQTAFDFNPPNGARRDFPFFGSRANPNDLQAMRNYVEHYEYEAIGNLRFMHHSANADSWTRRYDYEESSPIEPGKQSNRLTRTAVGGLTETYTYKDARGADVHGCMTVINAMKMTWDFEDQLQEVDLGGGGTAHYVYDAGGQRVRKVIDRQNGPRQEERIYVGGYEICREYKGDGQTATLERETLHVMDDKQRIALVEAKTVPALGQPLIRYQLGNHLGSASVELDKDGGLISYEEYHPYGTTSFQAKSAAEVSLKRYRDTGKERDEETGLLYYGARYYAPWLGRWISCDPILPIGGLAAYAFAAENPLRFIDPHGKQPIAPKLGTGGPIDPSAKSSSLEIFYGMSSEGLHMGTSVDPPAGANVPIGPPPPFTPAQSEHPSPAVNAPEPTVPMQDRSGLPPDPLYDFLMKHKVLGDAVEIIQTAGAVLFLARDLSALRSSAMSLNNRRLAPPEAEIEEAEAALSKTSGKLAERADELGDLLFKKKEWGTVSVDRYVQPMRDRTNFEDRVSVSGGKSEAERAQKVITRLLRTSERLVSFPLDPEEEANPLHAEHKDLIGASNPSRTQEGWTPLAAGVSNEVCKGICSPRIIDFGGTITPDKKGYYFLGSWRLPEL